MDIAAGRYVAVAAASFRTNSTPNSPRGEIFVNLRPESLRTSEVKVKVFLQTGLDDYARNGGAPDGVGAMGRVAAAARCPCPRGRILP